MSFEIKVGRCKLQVPREVEAKGGKAIDRWVEEQLKPKRKKRPKRKASAPQATPSPENES